MSVLIVTSVGDLEVDLETERCPVTTNSFLKLRKMKYYHGCLFHTVQRNFVAQTGDPTGTGGGGDSAYRFLDDNGARFFGGEIRPELTHSGAGTLAMAGGKNRNASQFYVTLREGIDYLDGQHTVFGRVAVGFETLARINEAYVDDRDRLDDTWLPSDSDETSNKEAHQEMVRSREARTNAVILEGIGDIPDADVKPPENVLFVCKLNPLTQDEDLYTMFARFGTVTSAEIVRGRGTGATLSYAFFEFEDKKAVAELAEKIIGFIFINEHQ